MWFSVLLKGERGGSSGIQRVQSRSLKQKDEQVPFGWRKGLQLMVLCIPQYTPCITHTDTTPTQTHKEKSSFFLWDIATGSKQTHVFLSKIQPAPLFQPEGPCIKHDHPISTAAL